MKNVQNIEERIRYYKNLINILNSDKNGSDTRDYIQKVTTLISELEWVLDIEGETKTEAEQALEHMQERYVADSKGISAMLLGDVLDLVEIITKKRYDLKDVEIYNK